GALRYDFFSQGVDPYEPDRRKRRYLSEDYYFCARWRHLGGQIFVHHGTKLQHAGPQIWSADLDRWLADRVTFAPEPKPGA
ncbi:MAG TPA: hypothetical protein VKR78_07600, partial [Acidimicrobiales bacterium]|nr:hypothetical protein [Acidimicrobiales bacterium]